MNLKPRFLLLTIILFVIAAIPAWFAVRMLAEGIVEQWAILYAEKQALYDKSRTLQPIMREVALSRQLANSQYIRDWARNPGDKTKTRRAIAEMENFRQSFGDRNYFVSLLKNGNYYFNNANNEFEGKELRYVLGRVEMWRGSSRFGLSVSAPFVWRCLSNLAVTPFPHPPHRTGHADFPHPALGQDLTPSPTTCHARSD